MYIYSYMSLYSPFLYFSPSLPTFESIKKIHYNYFVHVYTYTILKPPSLPLPPSLPPSPLPPTPSLPPSLPLCSSRSHLLVSIQLEGYNKVSGVVTRGRLTLVDLAGSERISRSEATGIRLVEAAAINKSLSALGQVWWWATCSLVIW